MAICPLLIPVLLVLLTSLTKTTKTTTTEVTSNTEKGGILLDEPLFEFTGVSGAAYKYS